MTPIKPIAILGATGSIGLQTLEVIDQNPHLFSVSLLTGHNNVAKLAELARKFRPQCVVVTRQEGYQPLKELLSDLPIEVRVGEQALLQALVQVPSELIVASMVGYSGLKPVVESIRAHKNIALANKETLVVAGSVIMEEARKNQVSIFPIDSEHSAIWQCLMGESTPIKKIWLTASGGPFRDHTLEELAHVTVEEALKHPNWSMGEKITIDSATMINKGFEMIEACHLFGVSPETIQIVVHPESVVHSMVEFSDGSVKAQMGHPDMRIPISLALNGGKRVGNSYSSYSFLGKSLRFLAPDFDRFPALRLAYEAFYKGGSMPCVLNGANEVLNLSFRQRKISFTQIAQGIEEMMNQIPYIAHPTLDDLWDLIPQVEEHTRQYVRRIQR